MTTLINVPGPSLILTTREVELFSHSIAEVKIKQFKLHQLDSSIHLKLFFLEVQLGPLLIYASEEKLETVLSWKNKSEMHGMKCNITCESTFVISVHAIFYTFFA